MKKIVIIAACLAVLFSLSACVPTKQDSISVGPDLSPNENVEYDFTQLHNDTLTMFEDEEVNPYLFITDMAVTGSNGEKKIYVKAVCLDEATEEDVKPFASAVLRYVNNAANVQDMTVVPSDSTSFGSLWNKFDLQLEIYSESEAQKEDGVPVYTLILKAGDSTDLDPNIEAYREEWERQAEILQRNEE